MDNDDKRPGENPHSGDINGYRKMSDAEVRLINEIKAAERSAGEFFKYVANHAGVDGRWAAMARSQLEQGFMSLVRSVARPSSPFDGPLA